MRQRIQKFQLRLTEQEKLQATQLATVLGISLSAVFRSAISKKQHLPPIPEINLKTYLELGKIGNNINQIAKVLNYHQKLNTAIPYDIIFELKQELANLSTFLSQIRSSIKQ